MITRDKINYFRYFLKNDKNISTITAQQRYNDILIKIKCSLPHIFFFFFSKQIFDDIIFAFFSLEMTIKMMAMGMWGKNTYLADSWNRLDFFIVCSGAFEYCLHMENLNLTAIRTIRVLRPLRAINRIPSTCCGFCVICTFY